ncbi:hypothetical protein [Pectinatus frisingensis]|uniref:hypothetical protein n=1 Tax=Pectinatus frisingensis TaxID=865 RepID=UPI0015F4DB3C|nr:hypothetical protein [Pectinatus frisingensis]
MSIINNLSNGILSNLLSNSATSSSSEAADKNTKTASSTNTNTDSSTTNASSATQAMDQYISSLQMQNNSLANYLSDDGASDSGLYSVLTYGQNAKIQNIIQQHFSKATPLNTPSTADSTNKSDTSDSKAASSKSSTDTGTTES